MFKRKYLLMMLGACCYRNETDEHGGAGDGGVSDQGQTQPQGDSLITRMMNSDQGQPQGEQEQGKEQEQSQQEGFQIPDKFLVKDHIGEIDKDATLQKVLGSFQHLEKRLGTGDIPPKTPDEYKVDFGEGAALSFDEFKADPENNKFLQEAHKLGMTNTQLDYILKEYVQRLPELLGLGKEISIEQAQVALSETWKTEGEFKSNLQDAYNAFNKFASPEDKQAIDEIGNNPVVIRLLANIGKAFKEDMPPTNAQPSLSQEDIKTLMMSEAYRNPNHPNYKSTQAKVKAHYDKNYGTHIVE